MNNLIQHTLLGPEISIKPPFWYPGSKKSAAASIIRLVPQKTKTVLSPFIGGGAVELSLTVQNVKVHGSDLYEPLINCWKFLLEDSKKLSDWCKQKLHSVSREELINEIHNQNNVSDFERAGYQWLKYSLNLRGIVARKNLLFYEIRKNGDAYLVAKKGSSGCRLTNFYNLASFSNPFLSVEHGDFEAILKKYPDWFVYLDPPYYGMSAVTYGDDKIYDKEFDHEHLAYVLHKRETPFLLSYSNHEVIRSLYPESDFDWSSQSWQQRNAVGKTISNEILIRPRKYLSYWS